MSYREVLVVEIREIMRQWLNDLGLRKISENIGIDRKTVRRYVDLAKEFGVTRDKGKEQITDELISKIVLKLQPGKIGNRGESWQYCLSKRESIEEWLSQDLKLTKVHQLLCRQIGDKVPYRTLHRFAVEELSFGKKETTIRVDDCDPGQELQVDFGYMGKIRETGSDVWRKVWALIFTSVYSRHMFVRFTFRQRTEDVIEAFEYAWEFFGGIFKIVIPDNMKAIVDVADPINPKLTEGFLDYIQSRNFFVDSTRVRSPKDKPRVERGVSYVRDSFFKGENFVCLDEINKQGKIWCLTTAGLRTHGTTYKKPLKVFEEEEKKILKPAPVEFYDVPIFTDVKVHDDQHFIVGKALYSVPVSYVSEKIHVRMDRLTVRVYHRRQLIRIHPRQPVGGRISEPGDFPENKVIYATRDVETLSKRAEAVGSSVAEYARRLFDMPEPWRRMRSLYRLIGLANRYGSEPVNNACKLALDLDVIDVTRIVRIVQNGLDKPLDEPPSTSDSNVVKLRFARPDSHFDINCRNTKKEDKNE